MTKRIVSLVIISTFFLAQNPMILWALEEAVVKSVRVSAESVYIKTDRPVKYKAFMVSSPPKIVVDLLDSRLKTLEEIPARGTFLKKVRTGQYKSAPQSISRIVLELSQKVAYDVAQKGNEIIVVVGGKLFNKKAKKKDSPNAKEVVKVILPENNPPAQTKLASIAVKTSPVKPSILKSKPKRRRSSFGDIMNNLPRDLISFDYVDADVKDVISMLVSKIGANVIFAKGVSGSISITLKDVPFDEAFKTILNDQNLATQQVGDSILRIASPQTLVSEQKKAMPQTKVFFLNYSKADVVMAQVVSVAAAKKRTVSCSADLVNNALIVTDTPMGLEEVSRLIKSLDKTPKQVLIEVKLVEVAFNNDFELGIQWAASGTKDNTVYGADVNLPVNVIYGAFRLGKIASNYMFDSVISAYARKGKAKILSDPKVATLNNKEASINITTEIPYTTTETTASTPPINTIIVTYITTGIVLKVLPIITSDGRVSLKLNPKISQVSPAVPAVIGGAPGIDTRSIDTEVIVADRETIVIGGLIYDFMNEGEFKIPLLGDLPLLGWLFKKKTKNRERRELLIFVTPKIIQS